MHQVCSQQIIALIRLDWLRCLLFLLSRRNGNIVSPQPDVHPSNQKDSSVLTAGLDLDIQKLTSEPQIAGTAPLEDLSIARSQRGVSPGSADVCVGTTTASVSEACQTQSVTRGDSSVQTEQIEQQPGVPLADASSEARKVQPTAPVPPAATGSPPPPEVKVRGPGAPLPTMVEFSRLHSPAGVPARSSPTLPALQRISSRPEPSADKSEKGGKKRNVATGRAQTDLRMGDLENWHRHVEDIRMQAEHRSLQHEARFAKAKLAVEQRDKRIKQLTGQLREFPGQMRRALDGLFRQRCLQVHEGDEDMRAQVLAMWSEVDGLLGAVRWKKTAM